MALEEFVFLDSFAMMGGHDQPDTRLRGEDVEIFAISGALF